MNVVGFIVIFVIWWWVAFLALLPMGITSRWEAPDDGVEGADPGAPEDPQLKRKMIRATVVAFVLSVVTAILVSSGAINFRD